VDLEFVIRAFLRGMDGVFVGACRLNECNYITHGNYDALGMVLLCKKILGHIGVSPERLKIAFMSAADGILFSEASNAFVKTIKELGPLGTGEGMDLQSLELKLEALQKLIPYIRLVERECLRVPEKTEKAYHGFFEAAEVTKVIEATIMDKLAMSEISLLLRKRPLPTVDIAAVLGLTPSEVSRHLIASSRQGLIRYDQGTRSYALA
jgi:DNA-binding transcriptional ArsR family regulator